MADTRPMLNTTKRIVLALSFTLTAACATFDGDGELPDEADEASEGLDPADVLADLADRAAVPSPEPPPGTPATSDLEAYIPPPSDPRPVNTFVAGPSLRGPRFDAAR